MWESYQNGVKAEACLEVGSPGGVWGLELADPSKARRGLECWLEDSVSPLGFMTHN